jgi:two-component system, NtrC family, nitrogen regulation sensor histidine kinase NtrY
MILERKQLWILWIGLCLFLAAFGWDSYFSGNRNIQRYKSTIENHLHQQELAADDILQQDSFIMHRMEAHNDRNVSKADAVVLERLKTATFNVCIFVSAQNGKDSLIYWTKNDALALPSEFEDSVAIGQTRIKFVGIKQSQYELRYRKYANHAGNTCTVAVLLPIKKIFAPFESKELKSCYPASSYIPLTLSMVSNDRFPNHLTTYDNQFLASIFSTEEKDQDRLHDFGVLFLFTCGFFLVGFFGDRLAKQMLIQNESPMLGICFFVASLVILRGCVWLVEVHSSELLPTFNMNTKLPDLENATFIGSLSALVINTAFFFWFSVFFNKEFRLPNYTKVQLWMRFLLAFSCYSLVTILNILMIGIFNDIINHMDNLLLLENLSDFNPQSILAVLALAVMQLSVFLVSHRLIKSANDLDLTNVQHFFAVDGAISIGALLYFLYGFSVNLPIPMYAVVLLVYMAIFIQYIRVPRPGLMWLIQWILVFSTIQSFFISQFNEKKEFRRLQKYAFTLANDHDPVAETRMKILVDTVARDPVLRSKTSIFLRSADSQSISLRIRQAYENDPYLSNNYLLKTFSSKRTSEIVDSRDSLDRQTFGAHYDKAMPVTLDKKVRLWIDKEGNTAYLALMQLPLSPDNPLEVAVQMTRSDMTSSRVFTEILADNHYKKLKNLNEYNYAIYRPDGELKERNQKGIYGNVVNHEDLPRRNQYGESQLKEDRNYMELSYRSPTDVFVMIGKYVPVASQFFNLWILFFVVTIGVLLILTALNHLFQFLPEALSLSFVVSFDTSLRNRLFIPVLGMLMFSYIAIFGFTFNYFKKIDVKYYNADFETKSNIISNDLEKEFRDMLSSGTALMDDPKEVGKKLGRQSEQYQTAIHYFDRKGDLFATTEDNIFDHGFLARRMNPTAFAKLKTNEDRVFVTDEKIGSFKYRTKFQTVRDTLGQLIGFLELPFYSRDRRIRTGTIDLSGYVGIILILLLLICISLVYIWTSRNISPIQDVALKLRQLRFGNKTKNELITTWRRQDEIGELISSYNSKVEELEETVIRLAEAERASAWRDMARQVAHEIRNPLTPMKLVVQHVEMLRAQNDPNLEKYAVRSHKVLLEQIANLERIVDEFHNFARMPQKAHNEQFALNDLVQNVADLFAQKTEENAHVDVSLTLPKETFMVYADRILLTGAFNNLVRNAIQAIPKDYKGMIQIKLYRENNVAIVRISDNGTGIPLDIQDKIFSPNFTTKPYGNGIGLLITKNIIQSVNGKIYFETVENMGTDFFIELGIESVEAIERLPPPMTPSVFG